MPHRLQTILNASRTAASAASSRSHNIQFPLQSTPDSSPHIAYESLSAIVDNTDRCFAPPRIVTTTTRPRRNSVCRTSKGLIPPPCKVAKPTVGVLEMLQLHTYSRTTAVSSSAPNLSYSIFASDSLDAPASPEAHHRRNSIAFPFVEATPASLPTSSPLSIPQLSLPSPSPTYSSFVSPTHSQEATNPSLATGTALPGAPTAAAHATASSSPDTTDDSTLKALIVGYCTGSAADVPTALAWFDQHPCPDHELWMCVLNAVIDDFSAFVLLFRRYLSQLGTPSGVGARPTASDKALLVEAYARRASSAASGGSSDANNTSIPEADLNFVVQVFCESTTDVADRTAVLRLMDTVLLPAGRTEDALAILRAYVEPELASSPLSPPFSALSPSLLDSGTGQVSSDLYTFASAAIARLLGTVPTAPAPEPLKLRPALDLALLGTRVGVPCAHPQFAPVYVQAYISARMLGQDLGLEPAHWGVLAEAFCSIEQGQSYSYPSESSTYNPNPSFNAGWTTITLPPEPLYPSISDSLGVLTEFEVFISDLAARLAALPNESARAEFRGWLDMGAIGRALGVCGARRPSGHVLLAQEVVEGLLGVSVGGMEVVESEGYYYGSPTSFESYSPPAQSPRTPSPNALISNELAAYGTSPHLRIDTYHSQNLDDYIAKDFKNTSNNHFSNNANINNNNNKNSPNNANSSPTLPFVLFTEGIRDKSVLPSPETLGRLINALGRRRDVSKIAHVYSYAPVVLGALYDDAPRQARGWFHIEDQMMEALAHAGDLQAAQWHRVRIVEAGGAPSADAYGAIISCVKNTTDDASVALEFFDESQRLGVRGNTFLYNTIISKLSRARKAKHVLKLFGRMCDEGIQPSSVTYGAVICACCRVGDEESAAYLFDKMVDLPCFRSHPSATPFNTMMQFYTQIRPDRERVLFYYEAMRASKVRPTAHTYKLLIDCYGTIEPVDTPAMERTFAQLSADRSVSVQGTHWAALINAWGCVSKNLSRALAVFESIWTHPSARRARFPLPDAIVFETLINVLVTLHRIDLVPQFIQRLRASGVHQTAYIANSLIKGYADAGDIEGARRMFDSLVDPPMGVAAPNNHTPHEKDAFGPAPTDSPVYREPSTWEAMIRAEISVGERSRASQLFDRMKTRMFPEALTSRIRRIVREEAVVESN
ncbi:hypothetical protein BOTBODRAFT_28398 [Botryobasidium botryosum FD-172 SS1]|uniref:Pentacotripeptide-repeat region of PRORP domain-containing protein n=1 Tax=Botryobasidium botryosum (strain FD-172 SS1) TaxID=930990 RepID=A0A067N480_BOTB1|nr:hypothetical protein BOTBODRAFT_28398 [Botryobasidium botryosum FD-172 SS1]